MANLSTKISDLWESSADLVPGDLEACALVEEAIELLDSGELRVAEQSESGELVVHDWLKKAILLLFKLRSVETIEVGPFEFADKLPLKRNYIESGVRVVPGASARWGSYIAPGSILMPSYVNIGARVGRDSMVDTWATVGSCAQIGERVHLSGGVGIGGVLEPPNAVPVFIGDDAFIGSRSMITDGARVGDGAVLGAGTVLNPSIPVIDASTGSELGRGEVPPSAIAVSASRRREFPGGDYYLPCVLVIRRLAEGERHDKLALNSLLREHGVAT